MEKVCEPLDPVIPRMKDDMPIAGPINARRRGPPSLEATFEKLCPFGIDLLGEACGVQLRTEQLEKLLHQRIAIGPSNAPSGRREFVCERKMFLKQLAGGV